MKEFDSLPERISHKQLNRLLSSAPKDKIEGGKADSEESNQYEEFKNLISEWNQLSDQLLGIIRKEPEQITTDKEKKEIMALGAFKAHLFMAIEASKRIG
mgnify:CR=1 FL=1|tara:strand:+ start:484 stop:783 length:300 start_codon:yes stop_codon:yes gene_type:complete